MADPTPHSAELEAAGPEEGAAGAETREKAAVPGGAGRHGKRLTDPLVVIGLLALTALWIGLVIWASPTFRGSDQYWYVEDVRTVMQGGTSTHELYPFSFIGTDARFQDGRGFIHDVPVLWVWAGAAKVLGGDPHSGIIAVNLLSMLGAAAFVYLTARRFLSRLGAASVAVLFLYVPTVFFITSQDMAEPFSALFIAAALWLTVRWPDDLRTSVIAQAAVAFAAVARIWTLPFLAILPMGHLVFGDKRTWPVRIGRALLALAAGLAVYVPLSRVFVNYMPPLDPMALLEVTRASNNMVLYFVTGGPRPFDLGVFVPEVAANAWAALVAQVSVVPHDFTITKWFVAADEWPANLAFLVALAGLFTRGTDRLRRWLMVLAVLAFGMHMGMAALYQNQPRYLVPLMPAIVLGAAAAVSRWWELMPRAGWLRRVTAVVLAAVLAGFVGIAGANASAYRLDSLRDAVRRARAVELIDATIPAGAKVALDTEYGHRWRADWAIFPRQELALGTDFGLTDADYLRMLAAFDARYLVTDPTSRLPKLAADLSFTGPPKQLGSADGYTVWELPPRFGQ